MSESKETAEWHDEFDRTVKNLFVLVSQRETTWLEMKFEHDNLVSRNDKAIAALKALVDAAKPFLSDKVIVETTGTLPLLDALGKAIDNAEILLLKVTE